MLDYGKKIYVAGRGLVGSALLRRLEALGAERVISPPHGELDLTDKAATEAFFKAEKPAYVFLAAAKIGGVAAKADYPADLMRINLAIQNNVLEAACRQGCEKLLFLGSCSMYPKLCPQPIKEEYLFTGPLDPADETYAAAKIAGFMLGRAYRRQFGFDVITLMPPSLYGPENNFHPLFATLLPTLLRRFHEARLAGDKKAVVWGTGTPRRELLHADDLASAALFLMNDYSGEEPVNIGSGQEFSIFELAAKVAAATGFQGELELDPSKPDGSPRKRLDTSKMEALGWRAAIDLERGLASTYAWYLKAEAEGRLRL